MLARLESTLPRGPEWRYEPKLDGFRGLLWRSNTGVARVLSRNLKDLSVSFPEVVRVAAALPLDTVIDGEIVIADARWQFRRLAAFWATYRGSSIGLPCGVCAAASAHASLRRASSSAPTRPLSATSRSSAASQW